MRYISVFQILLFTGLLFLPVHPTFAIDPLHRYRSNESSLEHVGITHIPEVKIRYYPVKGKNPTEWTRAIQRLGPLSSEGHRRAAKVHWQIRWKWKRDAPVGKRVEVSLEIILDFPIWAESSEPPSLVWEDFSHNLAKHELHHIRLALRSAAKIEKHLSARLDGDSKVDSKILNEEAKGFLRELREQDDEYDRVTDHGRTEGVRFEQKS